MPQDVLVGVGLFEVDPGRFERLAVLDRPRPPVVRLEAGPAGHGQGLEPAALGQPPPRRRQEAVEEPVDEVLGLVDDAGPRIDRGAFLDEASHPSERHRDRDAGLGRHGDLVRIAVPARAGRPRAQEDLLRRQPGPPGRGPSGAVGHGPGQAQVLAERLPPLRVVDGRRDRAEAGRPVGPPVVDRVAGRASPRASSSRRTGRRRRGGRRGTRGCGRGASCRRARGTPPRRRRGTARGSRPPSSGRGRRRSGRRNRPAGRGGRRVLAERPEAGPGALESSGPGGKGWESRPEHDAGRDAGEIRSRAFEKTTAADLHGGPPPHSKPDRARNSRPANRA